MLKKSEERTRARDKGDKQKVPTARKRTEDKQTSKYAHLDGDDLLHLFFLSIERRKKYRRYRERERRNYDRGGLRRSEERWICLGHLTSKPSSARNPAHSREI